MPWSKIPEYEDNFKSKGRLISYSQSINEGLKQALELDSSVFVLGEGVDDPGGIFGTTKGLVDQFGKDNHDRRFSYGHATCLCSYED
jgi:pyruvate dehydrogenase E1 component beta subunit